ncbi:RibD family protein [bacterium]|nr:RibD family protein [bacterium]
MFEAIDILPLTQKQAIAWQFLLAARNVHVKDGPHICGLTFDESRQEVVLVDADDSSTWLWLDAGGHWCCSVQLPRAVQTLFDLYLPVLGCVNDNLRVVAHLGQSLDSCIATQSGDSFYVTGEENRKHLHCLRALSDGVIVGASTALADDPQLTTRAIPGNNPVRIIIDPMARLPATLGVCCDAQVRTILLHQSSTDLTGKDMVFGPMLERTDDVPQPQVERWVIPDTGELMSPGAIVNYLGSRGMKRLFVEGGGVTVSRFFEDSALHRLHIAVAPLLVGQGTKALQLAGADAMKNAHRPPHAIYRMGKDILWDFDIDVNEAASPEVQTSPCGTGSADWSLNAVERII